MKEINYSISEDSHIICWTNKQQHYIILPIMSQLSLLSTISMHPSPKYVQQETSLGTSLQTHTSFSYITYQVKREKVTINSKYWETHRKLHHAVMFERNSEADILSPYSLAITIINPWYWVPVTLAPSSCMNHE